MSATKAPGTPPHEDEDEDDDDAVKPELRL